MVGICIVLATVVEQQGRPAQMRDVFEHVQIVRRLTERLQETGFPSLVGWQVVRRSLPENAVLFQPLDWYAWIDASGEIGHAYSFQGVKIDGPVTGEAVSIDRLVREREEATTHANGSFSATGFRHALLAIMSAGRPDLVERIIVRDKLFRASLDSFEKGLLFSLIVPIYNTSVHYYARGQEAQARASLVPALTWLLQTVPTVPKVDPKSRGDTIDVVYGRAFILAAEIRRRLRDKDESVLDLDFLDQLSGQRKIEYLIEHLDEAQALVATPGGAMFRFGLFFEAFTAEGKAGIAALRKTIESDPRLTRMAYARVDGQPFYVYSVADVARQYLRSIEGGRSSTSHKQDSAIRGLGGARHETLGAKR